jgi:hypothetical protein
MTKLEEHIFLFWIAKEHFNPLG